MSCSIENPKDPVLKALIDRYGQRTGTEMYLKGHKLDVDMSISDDPYRAMTNQKKSQIKQLHDTISKLYLSKDKTRIPELEFKIDELEQDIEKLENEASFATILSFANRDLEHVSSLLTGDGISDSDLLYSKKILDFWTSAYASSMVDPIDREDASLNYQDFQKIQGAATELLRVKWASAMHNKLKSVLELKLGKPLTKEEADKIIIEANDINTASSLFMDASTFNNPVVQAGDILIKEANHLTEAEAVEYFEVYDKLTKDVFKAMGTSDPEKAFEYFKQKDENGYTGNLTNRISQAFFTARAKLKYNTKDSDSNKKRYLDWLNNNTILFDARKLFNDDYRYFYIEPKSFTNEEIEAHKNELKRHLGEAGFESYLEEQHNKLKKFKDFYEESKERLEDEGLPDNILQAELDKIVNQYSPFAQANLFYDKLSTATLGEYDSFKGYRYITTVPRRYDLKNNETAWYDKEFEKIENSPALYAYYRQIIKDLQTFKSYYPKYVTHELQYNYLPEMSKHIMEGVSFMNVKDVSTRLYDMAIESLQMPETADLRYAELDSFGNVEKKLPIFMMSNSFATLTKAEIDLIESEASRKFPNKGVDSNQTKEYLKYKKKRKNEILQDKIKQKSFDLTKIMKAVAMTSLMYKNKARVEDVVRLVNVAVKEQRENINDPQGNQIYSPKWGFLSSKEGLKNTKEAWQYIIDTFYGDSQVKTASSKILKTTKDKTKEKELDKVIEKAEADLKAEAITQNEFDKIKFEVDLQKAQLGKQKSKQAPWNLLLKYIHIKGLGWNIPATTVNLGFGFISNAIHASGGQEFNDRQFRKAFRLISFNQAYAGKGKDGKKFTKLMETYGVVGDVREKGTKSYKTTLNRIKDKLSPYWLTEYVETINQGTTFVAMALNTKVTLADGTVTNLWDAYDNEGNLKEGVSNEWLLDGSARAAFKLKLEQVKKQIHGNYDPNSPVAIKKHVFGRALMMFRSWMAEGVASRFGSDIYDPSLGRSRKGRYRTYAEIGPVKGMAILGKEMANQMLKLVRVNAMGNHMESLSEIDRANMQKNAKEMIIYLSLIAMGLMLSAAADDLDDEERYVINGLINWNHRLQDDLAFFYPIVGTESVWRVIKDPMPAAKLGTDVVEFSDALIKWAAGEDIIKTGVNKGKSRLARESFQLFPFLNSIYGAKSYSNMVYRKTLIEDLLLSE